MIKTGGTMINGSPYPNWRYNNTRYGLIAITYQAIVSTGARVFAWICG